MTNAQHDSLSEQAKTLFRQVASADLPDLRGLPSIYFDPHWKLVNAEALAAVRDIQEEVSARRLVGRKRNPGFRQQQQFDDCVASILTVLLRAYVKSERHTVALPKQKERLNNERRYRPNFATVQFMRGAIDLLVELGFLEIKRRGYSFPGFAEITRYSLTELGVARTRALTLSRRDFEQIPPSDVILLRDQKPEDSGSAPLIYYEDSEFTRAARSRIVAYNDLIKRCEIDLAFPSTGDLRHDTEFDPDRRFLYRVFNNGSFDEGGRFYGGWWQHIRSADRCRIRINGQSTVEVDYSGLHPAMLFAMRGMQIPNDPYARVAGTSESPILRRHAKRTFNALLNAKSIHISEPKDFDAEKHGMSADEFRQKVIDAFPEFRDLIGSGVGIKLQRKDSDLADTIIDHFTKQKKCVLPIHDSFVVQKCYRSELDNTMKKAFTEKFGREPYTHIC